MKIEGILDAAQHLFAQKGFEQTPVADIAQMAGVAGGTIIYHFKTKDNLLFILAWRIYNDMFKNARKFSAVAHTGMEAVELFIDAYFDYMDRNPEAMVVLVKTSHLTPVNASTYPRADLTIIKQRINSLLREGVERTLRDAKLPGEGLNISLTILSMLMGASRMVVLNNVDKDILHTELKTFVRARLCPEAVAACVD